MRAEHIAATADGFDHLRLLGIWLKLLAQPRDTDIHAAIERVPVPVLRGVQDLVPGKHAIGMRGERSQPTQRDSKARSNGQLFSM